MKLLTGVPVENSGAYDVDTDELMKVLRRCFQSVADLVKRADPQVNSDAVLPLLVTCLASLGSADFLKRVIPQHRIRRRILGAELGVHLGVHLGLHLHLPT